jgi:ribonuclease E
VSGENGYREAKDFMRMLMPSHAKVVQPYREATPILVRSGIEAQLDRMLQPQVTLKSGGYLIINQTEALVAIDVNSGRSTKEHSIEETALHTNLEAAEEVARQLRLRDLAGLIVIDFIDMEENRNNRAVEKKLKDCLKNDRARIQVGRISHFGLMEMSRQRIRASVLESTMKPCPHCGGTGHVRSDSSVALTVVRGIEEFLLKDSRHHITVRTPTATALYVLNHKRSTLVELETRFGLTISVEADDTVGSQYYVIARGTVAEKPEGFVETPALPVYAEEPEEPEIPVEDDEETGADEQAGQARTADNGEGRDRKRRRRRRRRGGREREHGAAAQSEADAVSDAPQGEDDEAETEAEADVAVTAAEPQAAEGEGPAKKRRRGKRGGKRSQHDSEDAAAEPIAGEADAAQPTEAGQPAEAKAEAAQAAPASASPAPADLHEPVEEDKTVADKPKKPRRATRSKKAAASTESASEPATEHQAEATPAVEKGAAAQPSEAEAAKTETAKPRPSRRKPAAAAAPAEPVVSSTVVGETEATAAEGKPKRGGWWQRKGFF